MNQARRVAEIYVARGGPDERRRLVRHPGTGLAAVLDGQAVRVLDISLNGVRLGCGLDPGFGEMRFQLVRQSGVPGRYATAPAVAMMVARTEQELRLRFVRMSFPLARMIIEHVAQVSGVEPFIFR